MPISQTPRLQAKNKIKNEEKKKDEMKTPYFSNKPASAPISGKMKRIRETPKNDSKCSTLWHEGIPAAPPSDAGCVRSTTTSAAGRTGVERSAKMALISHWWDGPAS